MLRKREVYTPMEGEILVPIIGYEKYTVSNFGRVVSFNKPVTILVRQFISDYGYYRVGLRTKTKTGHFYVHRLMGQAFIPNPENKPQINHKNGTKTDNRLENLEWATTFENMTHAYKTGLCKSLSGEDSLLSTITNKVALGIFNCTKPTTEIMKIFGVSQKMVYRIKRGEAWAHITGKTIKRVERIKDVVVLEISKSTERTHDLMKKYGFSRSYIDHIRSGRVKSKVTGITFMPTRGSYNLSKTG